MKPISLIDIHANKYSLDEYLAMIREEFGTLGRDYIIRRLIGKATTQFREQLLKEYT